MAAISCAAANAKQKQPATPFAQLHNPIRQSLDRFVRYLFANRLRGGKKLFA